MDKVFFRISAQFQLIFSSIAIGGGITAAALLANKTAVVFFLVCAGGSYVSQTLITAYLQYAIAGHDKRILNTAGLFIMGLSILSWLTGLLLLV